MTVERRIVLKLTDIKAVSLECIKCGRRLTSKPDDPKTLHTCPCGQTWQFSGPDIPADANPFNQFLLALRDSLASLAREKEQGRPSAGFHVLLEVDEPPR
jgi:hypothetical protein